MWLSSLSLCCIVLFVKIGRGWRARVTAMSFHILAYYKSTTSGVGKINQVSTMTKPILRHRLCSH